MIPVVKALAIVAALVTVFVLVTYLEASPHDVPSVVRPVASSYFSLMPRRMLMGVQTKPLPQRGAQTVDAWDVPLERHPGAGVSARLRDFRKERFGSHTVERRRVPNGNGLWQYRLVPNVWSEAA